MAYYLDLKKVGSSLVLGARATPNRPTLHLVGPKRPTLHRLAPRLAYPAPVWLVAVQVGPLHLCAWVRASEPIFSFSHQNEFCGIRFSTLKPAGPCTALRPGRWVYKMELVNPSTVVKIANTEAFTKQ